MCLIHRCWVTTALLLCGSIFNIDSSLARTTAQQISSDNVSTLQRQGPDALGGIGDWHLSNGVLCAVISDIDHEGQFSTKGGNLIDLGFCGRADDYFPLTSDLREGSRLQRFDAQSVNSVNESEIVVVSRSENIEMTVRYFFEPAHPTQLQIQKRYRMVNENEHSFQFITPLQFNLRSLEPFVFASNDSGVSNGFAQEDFVSRGVSAMTVAARPADTVITISPNSAEHPISYGWHIKSAVRQNEDGQNVEVPHFVLADDESTAMIILSDSFYIGDGSKVGWLQLLQVPLLSLDFSSVLELHETIYVSNRGDVAGITDQLFTASNTVSAHVSEHPTALHIDTVSGVPVTHVVPDQEGNVQFSLPDGDYNLRLLGLGERSLEKRFTVAGKPIELGDLSLPKIAHISLPRGEAMRLIFLGKGDTVDPSFNDSLTQATVMEADGLTRHHRNNHVFLAGLESDPTQVVLPDGQYEVVATKGPEYSITRTELTISNAQDTVLDIAVPSLEVATPGYISADLHVHSGASFDNTFSDIERVRSFAAEHAEVMVSSEHDIPTDFNPIIKSMGLSDTMVSIPAVEITGLLPTKRLPYTSGHTNFFPYPPKLQEFAHGLVNHEDLRMREIIAAVKQTHPDVLVQLNHPRHDGTLSATLPSDYHDHINNGEFFEHMGVAGHPYQPDLPIDTAPNNTLIEKDPKTGIRDIDFDLLEVVNPGHERYQNRLDAVRKDWISLLKQGFRIVGVANSDSHGYHEQVGLPRTMVAMQDDRVTQFDQDEFIGSLKSGNAYGTNGPMLEVSLGDTSMGGTLSANNALLNVKVLASDWMPVSELLIQINGETVETVALDTALRERTIERKLEFVKDSFVTIEIKGPVTSDYRKIYADISPYAFSNPIYVDHDADGQWRAPGL